MYYIIGGDGKQYGPISREDLRKWISEGRLNSQSQAKAEGEADFRALATFPEFADLLAARFSPGPITPPGLGAGREAALQQVKGPAIALKVTAVIGLILVTLGLVFNVAALTGHQLIPQQPAPDPQTEKLLNSFGGGFGIIGNIIGIVIAVIIWIGAGKMQRLENYGFAMTAAIVSMIPCISPCCFLGLAFGIWALVVMNKPEVKSQFDS